MSEIPRVEIRLETPRMTVVAGETAEQQITLANFTSLPDDFDLTFEGVPSGWYSFSRDSVNLFPNWNETVTLHLSLENRVTPNLYAGRVVATARNQPGVQAEIRLEIEVLAPLKVQARLQPHRASGFKANYDLILRNRSQCEAIMNLQLTPDNPYCSAVFNPPQARISAGRTQVVNLKVRLAPRTPKDEKEQEQSFELQIQPQWFVRQQWVSTPVLLVDGEYKHRSRWAFLGRHPVLYAFAFILILFIVLWQILILPSIQNGLLLLVDRVPFQGTAKNSLRLEQKIFSDSLQNGMNPVGAFVQVSVDFSEENQTAAINLKSLFLNASMPGQLAVNENGDLIFKPSDPKQPGTFPWFFLPPDRVVLKLSSRIKDWLATQSPRQRMTKAEIEGNTLFVRLAPCTGTEPGCG